MPKIYARLGRGYIQLIIEHGLLAFLSNIFTRNTITTTSKAKTTKHPLQTDTQFMHSAALEAIFALTSSPFL
jgi:hypothetical protein